MSLSYEQIQGAIVQLPIGEQRRLFNELEQRLAQQDSSVVNGEHLKIELPDPEPNDRWLEQNADQYRGQWVALENGELLAHGPDGRAFVQAVKASGAKIPLLLFIEEEGKFPEFIGWL